MAEGTKTCTRCRETKSVEQFTRDRRKPDGRYSWCRTCRSEDWAQRRADGLEGARAYDRERGRRWKRENPEAVRAIKRRGHIKRAYGLTEQEYDAIVARGCAICGTHEGTICMDHDHATGEVRDALCDDCNRGLGCFHDDPALLLAANGYLERHVARQPA